MVPFTPVNFNKFDTGTFWRILYDSFKKTIELPTIVPHCQTAFFEQKVKRRFVTCRRACSAVLGSLLPGTWEATWRKMNIWRVSILCRIISKTTIYTTCNFHSLRAIRFCEDKPVFGYLRLRETQLRCINFHKCFVRTKRRPLKHVSDVSLVSLIRDVFWRRIDWW